jgi:hypothetical protein
MNGRTAFEWYVPFNPVLKLPGARNKPCKCIRFDRKYLPELAFESHLQHAIGFLVSKSTRVVENSTFL